MKTRRTSALLLLLLTTLCLPAAARQGEPDVRRVAVPGEKWAMELSLPGFKVERDEVRGDGKGRMLMAGDERTGYVVSVFLEPVPHGETAEQLRDSDASGYRESPLKPSGFKSGEYKSFPTLEYIVKEFRGQRVDQKHFNAYIVRGGFWAHVHLSKMLFKEGDEKLFYKIVDSVKFTEGATAEPAPAADVMQLLGEGSALFQRGDYAGAVGPYARALEAERQSAKLPRDLWRVLVDNLTMSYGISGDLKRAKETAEYGLSKDPDYPLFYYLLANIYAESGDLDNTIRYLKEAFARRKNVIAGERMPDPRTDDSFKRFMKDEKFLAALKEINP
jgi:tetratricopeptide (TPR) repeat protein